MDVSAALTTTGAIVDSVASSFVATKLVFLVISGAATTVVGAYGVWATVRAGRAAFVFARSRLAPRLLRAWVALRVRKWARHSSVAQLVPSGPALLVGVVEAEAVGHAEFSGAPSVVSRHEVGERGGGSVDRSLNALDFSLRLADGSRVRVLAKEAAAHRSLWLVDTQPHRWKGDRARGSWFCESRVAVGDQVEVIGRITREVDPRAERASDRQPALSWIVIAAKERIALRFATSPPLALQPVDKKPG